MWIKFRRKTKGFPLHTTSIVIPKLVSPGSYYVKIKRTIQNGNELIIFYEIQGGKTNDNNS